MMNNPNSDTNNLARQNQDDPNGLPLDQIKLNIGDSIQLQIGSKCYFASLIGYLKGQSFIVTVPDEKGAPIQLNQGQALMVRFFSDKRAYTFNTVVNHVATQPFLHLHLAYPKESKQLKDRQYDRVRVNITGTADSSNGESFSCVVQDISIGGALISLHDQTGAVNDPLLLTLRVVVNNVEYVLTLESEIRSVRIGNASNGSSAPILEGLAFNNLSKQDILALAAFDLLPDWNGSA